MNTEAAIPWMHNGRDVIAGLAEQGFALAIVLFDDIRSEGHPIMRWPKLGDKLGHDLEEAGVGSFESAVTEERRRWFIFRVNRLPAAIERLHAGLARRGFLKFAQILSVESSTELRAWWPVASRRSILEFTHSTTPPHPDVAQTPESAYQPNQAVPGDSRAHCLQWTKMRTWLPPNKAGSEASRAHWPQVTMMRTWHAQQSAARVRGDFTTAGVSSQQDHNASNYVLFS